MEETNIQIGGGRRLVLGFDAGCMTCSQLAKRIEDTVGDKLEIRSLNDPLVEHWREQALGKDAPWAPTLIEVGGARVKVWTGVRMGVRLSRFLGPAVTWRVIQTLGELRNESTGADVQKVVDGALSRGRFLKGAGGAMLAFGIFSGTTLPAFADTNKKATETGKQAEHAIFLMERHMRIESNGTLSLDEKGLREDIQAGLGEGIDRSVFAALNQNLAETNAKLLKGGASSQFSGAKAEDLFPTVSLQATEKSLISSKGCRGVNRVQYFWWGRRSWIDNCNTNKLVRRLFANAGVFAVIACFPVGGVPVAMASAIIALGGGAIDATNRGRGVYINYILRLVAVRVRPQ